MTITSQTIADFIAATDAARATYEAVYADKMTVLIAARDAAVTLAEAEVANPGSQTAAIAAALSALDAASGDFDGSMAPLGGDPINATFGSPGASNLLHGV